MTYKKTYKIEGKIITKNDIVNMITNMLGMSLMKVDLLNQLLKRMEL